MKTIFKLIPLVSVAVFGACNDIIESTEAISIPEKEIVLTATREGVNPGTKSFRLDDGSVWWSPAEEVSVFYGSGSSGGSKFVSMNTAIAETVELQGSVQMAGSGKDFWAVYPYSEENSCDGNSITTVIPDQQTGVEGNFSNDAFPTVAKSSSLSLAFWNICGGVKFFVSRSDIKSVSFKGNNNEPLAGKVSVSFGTDGTPVVQEVIDAKAEVTLVAPEGGAFKPGKYYYVTLLPKALDSGFTITFSTEKEKGELVSDKAQTIKRSTFGVLKNVDSKESNWESTVVEPEWVDLGLSVKWATFNVGATKPEEYGDYFAWGETEPKLDYSWESYKWCNNSSDNLTKYNGSTSYGIVDHKTVLDLEDDAAFINWGANWRMPTNAEWDELRSKCIWTWITDNGVSGFQVKSRVAGYTDKSIFLPASGNHANFMGAYCFYWSSSRGLSTTSAMSLVVNSDNRLLSNYSGRQIGHSIRPVKADYIPVEYVNMEKTSLDLYPGDRVQLSAEVVPSTAIEKEIIWSSSDRSVVIVSNYDNGLITAVGSGSATITAYGSSGVSAECKVTVKEAGTLDYVDLGLSVKWATMNVGATKPEEYGDYFAWGETEPKSEYNWSTYKWCNGSSSTLTKYNNKSSYGTVDNKTVLDLEDDAAHVNWGGSWRMPTDAEWTELRTKCTWIWTTENGVTGRKVTGPNGNSIFLPAAGFPYDTNLISAGSRGLYWSSSLNTDYPDYAYYVYFYSDNVDRSHVGRCSAMSVRPVFPNEEVVISVDFTSEIAELPQGSFSGLKEGTYNFGGYEFIIQAADKFYQAKSNDKFYLVFGKQGSYVQFPALGGKALTKVEFLTGVAASEVVIADIAKADGTLLGINTDKLKKGTRYEWAVSGEPGAAYRFVVTNSYNAQFQSIVLTFKRLCN